MKPPCYYVRDEGWERCADCIRRRLEWLHEDALEDLTRAEARKLQEQIKYEESDLKAAMRRWKAGSWFNRMEHGCLCCQYEDEFNTGQKRNTKPPAYWFDELRKHHQKLGRNTVRKSG